jgi:predicted amidohydrolase YtcJ
VIGVHDFQAHGGRELWQRYDADRRLSLRVAMSIPLDALPAARAIELRAGFGSDLLRVGPVKAFMDGTLGSRTAWMLDGSGDQLLSEDDLAEAAEQAAGCGLPMAIHAIGDGANRAALNALARTREVWEQALLRPRIEHVQVLDLRDVGRLARAGVIASMQPIHCTTDMFGVDRWWGDRGSGAYVFETLRRHGTVLAFGSDAPVDDLSPLAGIHAAVTRQNPRGEPAGGWYPAERLSAYDALWAYTGGAAYASGEEGLKGTLEVGKLGDAVVLSQDILAVPGPEILHTEVEATIVGGEVVHGED